MSEPKPLATLSSSLLARKGHAKPAMRPQNYNFGSAESGFQVVGEDHDDLGWNDMGHDETEPSKPVQLRGVLSVSPEATAPPPVVVQQEKLAEEFAPMARLRAATVPEPVSDSAKASGALRAAPGSKGKSAFTLRLDGERHLRLRLICAVRHRSAQQIVTQALDEFLDRQPDDTRLTAKR